MAASETISSALFSLQQYLPWRNFKKKLETTQPSSESSVQADGSFATDTFQSRGPIDKGTRLSLALTHGNPCRSRTKAISGSIEDPPHKHMERNAVCSTGLTPLQTLRAPLQRHVHAVVSNRRKERDRIRATAFIARTCVHA